MTSHRGYHVNAESYLVSMLLSDVQHCGLTITFDCDPKDAVRISIMDAANFCQVWNNETVLGEPIAAQLRDAIQAVREYDSKGENQ